MPYLNCVQCHLTVYSAAAYSTADSCPRCGAVLGGAPHSLFEPAAGDGREGSDDRHRSVRMALVRSGLFRDVTRSSGERSTRAG